MDDAYSNAIKRQRELQTELCEIETFLLLYQRFSRTNHEVRDAPIQRPMNPLIPEPLKRAIGDGGNAYTADEIDELNRVILRPRGRPADFVRIMETILKDEQRPMSRSEIVEAVERRGHAIPSDDKARYLGTILWRNSEIFENIEGKGYWLKDQNLPKPPDIDIFKDFGRG